MTFFSALLTDFRKQVVLVIVEKTVEWSIVIIIIFLTVFLSPKLSY